VTSFSDDFNRADGSPGASWVQISGTWVIVSNQLSPGTTGGTVVLRCATAMATSDNYAQATVTATTAVSHGVWCRGDLTLNSGYAVRNNGTNWALFSVVGGTFTSIGTYSAAAVVGDVVKIQAVGSTIKVFINATERISVTDTAVTTGTATGLRSEANTGIRFDNFSAADVSSGTTASADLASSTGSASDASSAVTVNAGAALATADAPGSTVSLGAVGDIAPATATAGDAGPALTLLPAVVAVTADAVSPAVSLAVTAGTAGVTADANNAVASTSGQTNALAGQPDSTASAPDAVAAVRVLAEAASVIASAMDVLFVPHLDVSAGVSLVSASVSPGLSDTEAFSGTASTTASAGGVLLAERGTSNRERVSGREPGPASGREPVSSVQGARPADRLSGREPSRGQ
jgi:hypothetical protein